MWPSRLFNAAGSPMSLLGGPLATVLTTGGSNQAVSGHQRDRARRAGAEPQHALRHEIDHDRARARGHRSQGYGHRERLAGSDVTTEGSPGSVPEKDRA